MPGGWRSWQGCYSQVDRAGAGGGSDAGCYTGHLRGQACALWCKAVLWEPPRAPATVSAHWSPISFLHRWLESALVTIQTKGRREPSHMIGKPYPWPEVGDSDRTCLDLHYRPLTWIKSPSEAGVSSQFCYLSTLRHFLHSFV